MDLWHLKVFKTVVDLKGFSKAANAIHLTQPTVSSHIREMEDYFECQLIDRLGRQALPTKAGERLYGYAERLLTLFEETETAMREFLNKISGRISIGGSTIPGCYLLPLIIGAFIKQYKDVHISLIVGDTERIIDEILNYKLELGVVGAKASDKHLVQQKLMNDTLRLIIPSDHKWASRRQVTLGMLSSEPFIIREPGSGTLTSVQHSLSRLGADIDALRVVAEMGSTAAVIQGIKNRVGVSILSPLAVKDELQVGTLKALTIEKMDLKRYFYLTFHKDRAASPLCRTFCDFLKNGFSVDTPIRSRRE